MSNTKFLSLSKSTVTRVNVTGSANGQGCGNSQVMYVGRDGSRLYRTLAEFAQNWTDVGKIIRATLIVYTDDGLGLMPTPGATDTPRIKVRRNTDEFTEGNNADGTFDSSDYTTSATTTSGAKSASMTKTPDEATEIDVTAIWDALAPKNVKQSNGKPGAGRTDHGISLLPYSSSVKDAWSGWSEDWTDASKRPQIRLEYDGGPTAPDVPVNMDPAGTVPQLPNFEGDFTDNDPADKLAYAEIEVYKENGTTLIYHTRRAQSNTAITNGRFSIPTDLHLLANTTYKWRARVTDNEGSTSAYSALVSFQIENNPPHDATLLPPNESSFATLVGVRFIGGYEDSLDNPQDKMVAFQVQMSAFNEGDPEFEDATQLVWNTGKRFVNPTYAGFDTAYGGRGLSAGTYTWRARQWDARNGLNNWVYSRINVTDDFAVDPADQDTVQIDSHTPWRLVFRDMLYTTSPDIELLQSEYAEGTVTLDDEAEVGNLIVGWATKTTAKPALPSGYKNLSLVKRADGGTNSQWGRMFYRVAGASDTPTATSAGAFITLMEWRAVYAGKFRASNKHAVTNNFRAGGNVTPQRNVPAVLLGAGVWDITGDSGDNELTPLGSTTEITDTADVFDGHRHWVGHRTIANPVKAYSLGGAYDDSSRYGGVTMVLHKKRPNRGPGEIVAVIENAKSTGASEMYNSPGELHFTLPTDHPQVGVLEPKQVHYEVQFYGDGWRGTFYGLLMDVDTSDMADAVFIGIDYLGLLDSVMDRRYDINNINKSEANGGSKYVNKTISYVVTKAIDRAIAQANSPVSHLTRGTIDAMNEKVTVWSTMIPTLQFVGGLIDSHRQGTGKNTRIKVRRTSVTELTFEVVVEENPGQVRNDMRMRYGELVNGYRVIFFGPNWRSTTDLIGRTRSGGKTYYTAAPAPGLDPAVWGTFEQAQFVDGVADLPDLKRRARQLALTSGKLGQQLALKIRQGLIQPKEGHDITDHIPTEIIEGITDTTAFGSGYYTIFGIAWEAGGPDGTDSSNDLILTLLPRADSVPPDDDLVESAEAIGNVEFASGFGPPDPETQTAKFYLDLNTGILYEKDDDANTEDDYDTDEGHVTDDEEDQTDEGDD